MKTFSTCALSAGMLFLFSCSNEPEDKRDRMQDRMQNVHEDMRDVDMTDREGFENDRQDILSDLRDLRADINDDLADSEKELADRDLDAEDRTRHERLRTELQQQRTIVDRHIEKVENADMSDWDRVRNETRTTLHDADLFYEREEMQRRRGTTGGAGVYEDRQVRGDGTVNTNRNLDLNRNANEVR